MYVGRVDGPPLVGWLLLPRRLAEAEEEEVHCTRGGEDEVDSIGFFSVIKANPLQQLFASLHYSVAKLAAAHPAVVAAALGGDRWAEHMRRWVPGWGAQGKSGAVSGGHQEVKLPPHLLGPGSKYPDSA